jgi:hypothetical protein
MMLQSQHSGLWKGVVFADRGILEVCRPDSWSEQRGTALSQVCRRFEANLRVRLRLPACSLVVRLVAKDKGRTR